MATSSRLETARKKIKELRDNEGLFVRIKYTNVWKDGEDSTTFDSIPTLLSVKAAAMDMRHFLADKSPIVMSALVREVRIEPGADIVKLNEFYTVWKQKIGVKPARHAPYGIALNLNDHELKLSEQIDLWMNGELFHVDKEKADTLKEMHFSSFRDMSWMIFVSTLQDLAQLLFYFEKQFLQKVEKHDK